MLVDCRAPKNSHSKVNVFKVQCSVCNGFCYSPKNIRTCNWCAREEHFECHNQSLCCKTCCEKIIPGFNVSTYELHNDYTTRLNNITYNPYDRDHFNNLIRDSIETEEHHNSNTL